MTGINEKFICEVDKCGESFELASLLSKHLQIVHEKTEKLKTFKCCYCRNHKEFTYRQTYEMHVRTAHKVLIFGRYKCDLETCKEEPFLSVNELNEHLKSHLEEPDQGINAISFCGKCDWGFLRSEWRDLHQLCHISPGQDCKIECPRCSERFGPNVKYLQNHFNMKHGVNLRPFLCDQCESTFLFERYFEQHKYHHTKQNRKEKRDWICELCGAKFSDRCRLNTHMIRHEEPKFSCDVCGSLFKFKQKLNEHKKHMHDPDRKKGSICSECGKSFYSTIGLRFHFDSAHKPESEWDLKCPKCPRRFYRNLYLGIHLKTCDGNEEDEKRRLKSEIMDKSTMGTETEKNSTLSSHSSQEQQNECQEDLTLSSSSISQQSPYFQSDLVELTQQSNDGTSPDSQELTEMALLPISQDLSHAIQLKQSETQFLPKQEEETCDMNNPVVRDDFNDQVKIEVGKENSDEETPDNFGNEDESDWSRDGASPVSDGGTVSSDDDEAEETSKTYTSSKTRWNLRGRQVTKTEDDYEDESSEEIDNLEKKFLLNIPSLSSNHDELQEKRASLKCPHCPKTCKRRTALVNHLKVHGKLNKQLAIKSSCPECFTLFRSKIKLCQHIATLHENEKPEAEKTIQCCYCSQRYAYQQTHDLHLNTIHKRKLGWGFKCDLESCQGDTFVSIDKLNEHLKTHLGQREISFCEKCNWGFLRPELRDLHQLGHIAPREGDYKMPCPQCPKIFLSLPNLRNHFNTQHGLNLERFTCDRDSCNKSFFTKISLRGHMRWHDKLIEKLSTADLKCDQCGIAFVEKDELEAHLNSGHLFCCLEPGCEQKFDTNRKLKIHITMKHLDSTQREWVCDLCGAKFSHKGTLNCHMVNHAETKYTCDICGATFKRKDKLPLHMESKHNPNRVKSWICSLCGKSYHTVVGLQYHNDSEHKKESEWHLKCPHCPRRFYRNMYLYRHLKTCKAGEGDGHNVQSTSSTMSSKKQRLPRGKSSGEKKANIREEEEMSATSTTARVETGYEEKVEHRNPSTSEENSNQNIY